MLGKVFQQKGVTQRSAIGAQHTRFGSLSNLDLHLVSVCQELWGDTKAARGHLLDARVGSVAGLQAPQVGEGWGVALLVNVVQVLPPHWVLSPLARVALTYSARDQASALGYRLYLSEGVHSVGTFSAV